MASAQHQAGQLDVAEALYRKVLEAVPNEPNALHLLGVVAYQRGDARTAVDLIGRALAALPDSADVHGNLGNALRAVGRLQDAALHCRRAVALAPDVALFHANLARVLNDLEAFAEALAEGQRAVTLDPKLAFAHTCVAAALEGLRRPGEAGTAYQGSLRLDPDQPEVLGRFARVLAELEHFDAAMVCHRRSISLKPGDPRLYLALSETLISQQDVAGAIAAARSAAAFAPDLADTWTALGICFNALGQFDEAGSSFRRALAIDPASAKAYRGLMVAGRHTAVAAERDRLIDLLAQPNLPTEHRIDAGFALGDWFDSAGEYDAAFHHYATANALAREALHAKGHRFDAVALRQEVDALIATFTPAFFARVGAWGNPSELPVFAIGMPRSGSTLVEQILVSHSAVVGRGESRNLERMAQALTRELAGHAMADWPAAAVRRYADAHVARLAVLAVGAARVVDKMPDNVFGIGLGAALFPGARVLLCQRDLRDVCVSCFFQRFADPQVFSVDLADCARRAIEVRRLMAHWRAVLPVPMLDVAYEALVGEPEVESRRLVGFLGLEWEAACLEFHRTERPVLTASSWQVRQPIYAGSVGRWRNYARHLDGMLAILDTVREQAA